MKTKQQPSNSDLLKEIKAMHTTLGLMAVDVSRLSNLLRSWRTKSEAARRAFDELKQHPGAGSPGSVTVPMGIIDILKWLVLLIGGLLGVKLL